jgi:hypothetical protein
MASDNRLAMLYDPTTWLRLNCLVLVDPNWAILPVRMRSADKDPYTIAVTPLYTREGRWYTLADVLASVVLGGPAPKVRRAIRFVPKGRHRAKSTLFRGTVPLRSNEPFFKVIVEQRQIAKRRSKDDPDLAGLDMGVKQTLPAALTASTPRLTFRPAIRMKAYRVTCIRTFAIHRKRSTMKSPAPLPTRSLRVSLPEEPV